MMERSGRECRKPAFRRPGVTLSELFAAEKMRDDASGCESLSTVQEAENGRNKLRKAPSMLFDLELEEASEAIGTATEAETGELVTRLRALIQPRSTDEARIVQVIKELADAHDMKTASGVAVDHSILAHSLQACGYGVVIRTAVGGGTGGECLKNLRHIFLRCSSPGCCKTFVIDTKFKEQFEIMHPTEQYAQLLEAIPVPLVVAEDRVPSIVQLLCQEMSSAFREKGTVLPPWRKASSLLTKWLPRKSMDQPVEASLEIRRTGSAPNSSNAVLEKYTGRHRVASRQWGMEDPPHFDGFGQEGGGVQGRGRLMDVKYWN